MAKKQLNVRIPEMTERQLEDLKVSTGMTVTQVVIIAISNLHAEFSLPKQPKGNE